MATPKFPGPVPHGAIDYIKHKDLRPGFHYQDVWGPEHASGFTVAKMMKVDLLGDVQQSLADAAQNGETLRDWSKKIRPEMEKRGWWGVKQMTDPLTGEIKTVQLGSARRLKTIYNSNMRAARASGQWQRIQRNKATHPYLLYQLGPSVHHRPWHVALEGTLLPVDDPTWDEIYPPKGYGCKCWVQAVTRHGYGKLQSEGFQDPLAPQEIDPKTGLPTGHRVKQAKPVKTTAPKFEYRDFVNKRTGAISRVPAYLLEPKPGGGVRRVETHIHPAWTGNVGKHRAAWLNRALGDKLDGADQQLARAAVATVAKSPILDQYLAEARAKGAAAAEVGELPVGFAPAELKARLGADSQVVRLTPATLAADPALDAGRLRLLDQVLAGGAVADAAGGQAEVSATVGGKPWTAILAASGKRLELKSLKPAK